MKKDLVGDIQSGIQKKAFVFGTNIGAEILKIPAIKVFTEVNAQVDAIHFTFWRTNGYSHCIA